MALAKIASSFCSAVNPSVLVIPICCINILQYYDKYKYKKENGRI